MATPDPTDFAALWTLVSDQFALDVGSIHGPRHWRQVERNALQLAAETPGADATVCRLFALFHDSRRQSEFDDHQHGLRGGELAQLYRAAYYTLPDAQFATLYYACAYHERGRTSDDATIACCWDADRLDLPRVGIQPLPDLMSTRAGKLLAATSPRRRM